MYEDFTDFNVELEGEECFIFKAGVNKGVTTTPNKVHFCLLISTGAKALYSILRSYAFGSKEECFPSRETLMVNLQCNKNTLSSYINDLVVGGLIECIRGFGKKTVFRLLPISTSKAVIHSEFLYGHVKSKFKKPDEFIKKVKEYRSSSLFLQSDNVEIFEDEILEWFGLSGTPQPEVAEEPKEDKAVSKPKRVVKVSSGYDDLKTERELNQVKKPKRKPTNHNSKSVSAWNTKDFINYFNERFNELTGLGFRPVPAHTVAQFDNVIKSRGNNELVKEYIDVFLDNKEQFETLDIHTFCLAWNQSKLDNYKLSGKFGAKSKTKTKSEDEEDDFILEKLNKLGWKGE